MRTHLPKVNLDQRKWHVIDANGAVLGRLPGRVDHRAEARLQHRRKAEGKRRSQRQHGNRRQASPARQQLHDSAASGPFDAIVSTDANGSHYFSKESGGAAAPIRRSSQDTASASTPP